MFKLSCDFEFFFCPGDFLRNDFHDIKIENVL